MVDYIDAYKDQFGIEPICSVLQFAPSTYYAFKARLPSTRSLKDAVLLPLLLTLWVANYRVYGARKMWKAMRRSGEDVGRDQVARLMRQAGIHGVNRSKKVRTTLPDEDATRHPDLVDRKFVAEAPNELWVTDLTYVPTWSGVAYVCFIVDAYSRMIVGWRCAANMRTTMVLDALEMARWSRGTTLEGLVCHSDAGSQLGFNWSSQHLDFGGGRWAGIQVGARRRQVGHRCGRPAARRVGHGITSSGSGCRLRPERAVRMPPWPSAWRRRSAHAGSGRQAACPMSSSTSPPGAT